MSPHFSAFSLHHSHLEPIECLNLSENVNVIYGHNEAGKSRVRDFLEWIMFASSEEVSSLKTAAAKKAYAHIDNGLSGKATLLIDNNTVALTQQFIDGISQTHVASPHLRASDISRALTDGLSRAHYNNVFSLSLDELTQAESHKLITEDEMMNMFFGASLSGSGISPPSLLSELSRQRDELYSEAKQAKKRRINKVLKEINETSTHIKQLQQQENGLENIDSDLAQLNEKLTEIDERIRVLHQSINEKTKLIDNAEDFLTYELLSNEEKPRFSSELISHIVDIKMLIHTCKELIDQGDQKEKDRINSTLQALEAEQALQYSELSQTIAPDELDPSVRSPQFLSVIESEDRNRIAYATEIKTIKDQVAQYSKDLGLLTKSAEQLARDIENASNNPDELTDKALESPQAKRKKNTRLAAGVFSALCVALGITGFVVHQPIVWVISAVLACAACAFALFPPKNAVVIQPVATKSNELYLQQMHRELSEKNASIDDLNGRISALIDEQKLKDSERELSNHAYVTALIESGLPSDIDPHLAALYLDAFKDYAERTQRLNDLRGSLAATCTRLDAIFSRAENLRDIARGTECETTSAFETLEDIHVWATALYEIAIGQKKQEEDLHHKENQLREIEKNLSMTFSSIENARDQYSTTVIADTEIERNELSAQREQLEQERKEIDHSIVRLTVERDNASTSTAIADAVQHSQQLVDELKDVHQHYRGLFVAHHTVSVAFEKFRQDNQPELLRVASLMLADITRGEWNSVTVEQSPSGKNEPIIRVVGDRAPQGLLITQLSRGTREQLYLCLRLALMQTSHRGKHVPVLFDDIAVNFDRTRSEALAPIIKKIGQTRQVIYFTCHETTRDILAEHAGARIHSI